MIDVYQRKKRIHSLKLEVFVFQPSIVRCHVSFKKGNALILSSQTVALMHWPDVTRSIFNLRTFHSKPVCSSKHVHGIHESHMLPFIIPQPQNLHHHAEIIDASDISFAKRLTGWIHAAGVGYLPQNTPFLL